jgi:hypothetical protein
MELTAGTAENLAALGRLLAPWKCCGAPNLCGAGCRDDELSAMLADAERLVRSELERLETTDG